jgi:hypothetical protein
LSVKTPSKSKNRLTVIFGLIFSNKLPILSEKPRKKRINLFRKRIPGSILCSRLVNLNANHQRMSNK